ncbi:MAG: right-handed parallel beta-helix repeat-containing protein [Candidatus Dormibacteria bacterium]
MRRVAYLGIAAAAAAALGGAPARAASPNVLLVGPAGTPGAQFTSIQDAVDHALPGDWVLVAPGVYHEKGYSPTSNAGGKPAPAEVFITKPNLHLRGMNRDTVIVDGTNLSTTQAAGTAPAGSTACSSDPALQDPGVPQSGGGTETREGILVWKTSGVSIENLTSCNSLDNEIWWDQGDGGGIEAPMVINGDYISATSTYYKDSSSRSAQYGIFTSDEMGPAVIDHSYASNMTDSAYYIGACRNCNMVLDHPHAENSALGLSSTNAGGNFIVENGEWDNNRTGLVSNAQNNDDYPSPEYGQCVPPSTSPAGAGPNSCYVMRGNYIHDNNNPNTPGVGLTAVSAIGTGIELVATQHISVIGNTIANNGSWGVITHDFPDPESGAAQCQGGVDVPATPTTPEICTWFSLGNHVSGNTFTHNGYFGNPTNGDVANEATGANKAPSDTTGTAPDPNCFSGDTNTGGSVSADPPTLETAPCSTANSDTANAGQILCATGAASLFAPGLSCPSTPATTYPQHDGQCTAPAVLTPAGDTTNGVCFLPISYTLSASVSPPMPDPCSGVPANAFCPPPASTPEAPAAALLAIPAALGVVGALLVARRRPKRRLAG